MSEFKVAGTYIFTTANYTHYKIYYSNTIFYMLTWGYNADKKNNIKELKTKEITQPQNKK